MSLDRSAGKRFPSIDNWISTRSRLPSDSQCVICIVLPKHVPLQYYFYALLAYNHSTRQWEEFCDRPCLDVEGKLDYTVLYWQEPPVCNERIVEEWFR